ncbi:hypothetical protein L2E82_03886 [Cichorium intybus]|uniref:Uncharacterized protein n=1 Tax=Cichorium intybus TaxID=13427 RepID=A0ACB9H4P9_CICIN|nr:hypothetical protein L2E82_03886 [Cichorium intybus]
MNKYERQEASKHEDGVDLISSLPDPILILILSGLPSTEELIRTSILSRRWRYLWTSIPSIDLEYRQGRNQKLENKFKEFVYWVLLSRSMDLDSFRLSCSDYYSMSTVEQWIRATVMRNVKQLDLSFSLIEKSEDMVMPHCLVTCASLETDLNFLYECIKAAYDLALPNLKSLELTTTNSHCTDKALIRVLKICPKLESLSLTIERVSYGDTSEDSDETDESDYPKLDEAGNRRILTRNVKWVESFEFNGEKPKLVIDWYGTNNDWLYIHAKWGNKAK